MRPASQRSGAYDRFSRVLTALPPVMTADRVTPVNLLTATRIRRVPVQRLGFHAFQIARRSAVAVQRSRARATAQDVQLPAYTRLPGEPGAVPAVRCRPASGTLEPPRGSLLLNFNSGWEPYFGAFVPWKRWLRACTTSGGSRSTTRASPRCRQGERGSVRKSGSILGCLTRQHYYAAYPHATTNDVRSAVRVRREMCSLAIDLATRHGGACSTEVVTRAFDEITARVRHCLQPIDFPAWRQPPTLADGSIGGIVAIFPLRPGHQPFLRQAIEQLPSGVGSPFRNVPGTHFARLALLDRRRDRSSPQDGGDAAQLLSVVHRRFRRRRLGEGRGGRYFRAMFRGMPKEVQKVWTHCDGFENVDDEGRFVRCPRSAAAAETCVSSSTIRRSR